MEYESKKKGLIKKTLERCKTFAIGMKKKGGSTSYEPRKTKSMPCISLSSSNEGIENGCCSNMKKRRVSPEGCFSVYVGAEKQRFVIKTAYVNHPLFKMLLEEAESEYGYNSEGPLVLPCHVSFFVKVLAQMDSEDENDDEMQSGTRYPCSPYHLLTSPRAIADRMTRDNMHKRRSMIVSSNGMQGMPPSPWLKKICMSLANIV